MTDRNEENIFHIAAKVLMILVNSYELACLNFLVHVCMYGWMHACMHMKGWTHGTILEDSRHRSQRMEGLQGTYTHHLDIPMI